MRVNAITPSNSGMKRKSYNQSANKSVQKSAGENSFTGGIYTKYVHDAYEDKKYKRRFLEGERITDFDRFKFYYGKVPLYRVEGTYYPDIIMKGRIYVADPDEWVNDWGYECFSGISATPGKVRITEEKVNKYKYSLPDLTSMKECIEHDIRYHNLKIKEAKVKLEKSQTADKDEVKDEIKTREERLAALEGLLAKINDSIENFDPDD